MATLVKTPSGTWKALLRKNSWPTVAKTFRTKRETSEGMKHLGQRYITGEIDLNEFVMLSQKMLPSTGDSQPSGIAKSLFMNKN